MISVSMDLINAFIIYKIVQFKYRSGLIPFWAAGIFLCLPTILVNSALWGQCDSLYTGFLLLTLYFLIKEQPFPGMLAFSVSFAFKAQAIFIAPFLAVLFFKNRIKLWHFFLVPGVYIIICLPVILLGRDWMDVLTIYFQQGDDFSWLSANAPNFYTFIPNDYYQVVVLIGLFFASIVLGLWIDFTAKGNQPIYRERLVFVAFISVVLSPFLLPKMHDRYFYPADVFSLAVAFFLPEFWFLPLAYQVISGLSYTPYLLGFSVIPVSIAVVINTATIIILLIRQFQRKNTFRNSKPG
jgi:Gpi18-like mannosyltransferase